MKKSNYPRFVRHGKRGSGTYSSWAAMKGRCLNPNNSSYARYGGAGISVCERWFRFENFLADMGDRPPGSSIDRIDGSGNYEPGNCRWVGSGDQSVNRPDFVRKITYEGITDTISGWARRIGCGRESLADRIDSGWDIEKALGTPFSRNTPNRKTARVECDGKLLTIKQWSCESGIPDDTIRHRLKIGWATREAIFSPLLNNKTRHQRNK